MSAEGEALAKKLSDPNATLADLIEVWCFASNYLHEASIKGHIMTTEEGDIALGLYIKATELTLNCIGVVRPTDEEE
jgi:hypothetical protein